LDNAEMRQLTTSLTFNVFNKEMCAKINRRLRPSGIDNLHQKIAQAEDIERTQDEVRDWYVREALEVVLDQRDMAVKEGDEDVPLKCTAEAEAPPVKKMEGFDPQALADSLGDLLPKKFSQYDLDDSGDINDLDELEQLTINLSFTAFTQSGGKLSPAHIDMLKGLVQETGLDSEGVEWTQEQFHQWYVTTALATVLADMGQALPAPTADV
jgi:hypothetical protein